MRRYGPRTLCLDFDGVIHLALSRWRRSTVIPDGPVRGAREAIEKLRARWVVKIYSGRCASVEGRQAIARWLDKHGIEVDEICEHKPLADIYVDDRAVKFSGDWAQTLEDIRSFRHWQARAKAQRRRRAANPRY